MNSSTLVGCQIDRLKGINRIVRQEQSKEIRTKVLNGLPEQAKKKDAELTINCLNE